jgi:hypothetical protein
MGAICALRLTSEAMPRVIKIRDGPDDGWPQAGGSPSVNVL